jgi:hypothetical protein
MKRLKGISTSFLLVASSAFSPAWAGFEIHCPIDNQIQFETKGENHFDEGELSYSFSELSFLKSNQLELVKKVSQSVIATSGCTGTTISNQGHVLLASHCLWNELKHSGVTEDIRYKNQLYVKLKPKADLSQIDFNGYKLVSFGPKGWIAFNTENICTREDVKALKELQNSLRYIEDDFAILKPRVPKNSNSACVPVRPDKTFAAGDSIWTVGFPIKYDRRPTDPQYSFGAITSGYSEIGPIFGNKSKKQLQEEYIYYNDRDLFWSTLSENPGGSGSGVFDWSGNLTGIVVHGPKYGDAVYNFEYRRGATALIGVDKIQKEMLDLGIHCEVY